MTQGGWRIDAAGSTDGPAGQLGTVRTRPAGADTIVPGAKRYPGDHAIAGAAPGPGAVQAGAITLLRAPELGLTPLLPGLAGLLNVEATAYATAHGRPPLSLQPPFVGLTYADRAALAAQLLRPGTPDQKLWLLLALVSSLAFDTAAHLHTPDAVRQGHPGLAYLRFPRPDADGLWRYPRFSYQRTLADPHPSTTPSGSPA
jgi:hypothetical protein